MQYTDNKKKVNIVAKSIEIGENVEFGNNISVLIKGDFRIGDRSRLGDDTEIRGNNVFLGKDLFNSAGLRIGGGGRQHPTANFSIGDRCTIHNNYINVSQPVVIGNDVGLSRDVSIITHGYWLSVFEGYPALFSGVKIGDGVIIGYRSLILMGVNISENIVVGANSLVNKSLTEHGIYAGNPARMVKNIKPMDKNQRIQTLHNIINEYLKIAEYHNLSPEIFIEYPFVLINKFKINVESFEYEGVEDKATDDFRDYIRKWGIRIYTNRPFRSNFSFE